MSFARSSEGGDDEIIPSPQSFPAETTITNIPSHIISTNHNNDIHINNKPSVYKSGIPTFAKARSPLQTTNGSTNHDRTQIQSTILLHEDHGLERTTRVEEERHLEGAIRIHHHGSIGEEDDIEDVIVDI